MKNIIKIDINNPYYFEVENIDDGSNSIWMQFTNHSDTGKCEIYHCDAYYTEIQIGSDGMVEIPSQYYCDGSTMHIRYENGITTGFIHVTGDGSQYGDLGLKKITNCIATIVGDAKQVIGDYSTALAKIISNHTKSDTKSCYDDLDNYRRAIIEIINAMGGATPFNATIGEISGYLSDLNVDITAGLNLIAAAITSKGVETFGSDSFLTMAANIEKIPSEGYGVSGYIDTTIETSGGIFAIYGLYTVEEQEAS